MAECGSVDIFRNVYKCESLRGCSSFRLRNWLDLVFIFSLNFVDKAWQLCFISITTLIHVGLLDIQVPGNTLIIRLNIAYRTAPRPRDVILCVVPPAGITPIRLEEGSCPTSTRTTCNLHLPSADVGHAGGGKSRARNRGRRGTAVRPVCSKPIARNGYCS